MIDPKDRARFEAKVDRSDGPEWCHHATVRNFTLRGKTLSAPRVAWELQHGEPPPAGFEVVRTCTGKGTCVNPKHLKLAPVGTTLREACAEGSRKGNDTKHMRGRAANRVRALIAIHAAPHIDGIEELGKKSPTPPPLPARRPTVFAEPTPYEERTGQDESLDPGPRFR